MFFYYLAVAVVQITDTRLYLLKIPGTLYYSSKFTEVSQYGDDGIMVFSCVILDVSSELCVFLVDIRLVDILATLEYRDEQWRNGEHLGPPLQSQVLGPTLNFTKGRHLRQSGFGPLRTLPPRCGGVRYATGNEMLEPCARIFRGAVRIQFVF
ncbi:hypothetical protein TNCV_2025871 [Trichonephila clavipes]|nr:hypothetical protein TNCV_2025871 [Trichonephila clavipes]